MSSSTSKGLSAKTCIHTSKIEPYLFGELGESDSDFLAGHLENCSLCEYLASQIEESNRYRLALNRMPLDINSQLSSTSFLSKPNRRLERFTKEDVQLCLETFQIPGYRLIKVVGQGGSGLVFEAEQESTQRRVALKILNPVNQKYSSEESVKLSRNRFRAEITAAARIDHENVVRIVEGGEFDGRQYCIMQLVDGLTLAQMADEGLDIKSAAEYTRQAALGVAAAHKLGVIHRDIKPHNILVSKKQKRALVSDFGLAKITDRSQSATQLTFNESIFGTLDYMSPEQLADSSKADESFDVYSLGATLYCCLTGRPPFRSENVCLQVKEILESDPIEPIQLVTGLHPDLNAICMKCLEKDPSNRYPSAEDLACDIRRYLDCLPTHARPASIWSRFSKLCMRNRTVTGLISTIFMLVVIGATAGLYNFQQTMGLNNSLVETNEQLALANSRNTLNNQQLKESLSKENRLRKEAEDALVIAELAINKFFLEIAGSENLVRGQKGQRALRDELLFYGREKLAELSRIQTTPQLEYRLANSLVNYANLQIDIDKLLLAELLLREAEKSSRDLNVRGVIEQEKMMLLKIKVAQSLGCLMLKQRRHEDAEKYFEQALHANPKASDESTALVLDAQRLSCGAMYAFALRQSNRTKETEKVLADCEDLAADLLTKTDMASVRQHLSDRQLAVIQAGVLHFYNVNWVVDKHDKTPESSGKLERCIRVAEQMDSKFDTPTICELKADIFNNYAIGQEDDGLDTSVRYFEKSILNYTQLCEANPGSTVLDFKQALARQNMGLHLMGKGDFDEAEELIRASGSVLRNLIEDRPDNIQYKVGLGLNLLAYGRCLLQQGRYEDTSKTLAMAIETYQTLRETSPTQTNYLFNIGRCFDALSKQRLAQDKYLDSFFAQLTGLSFFSKLDLGNSRFKTQVGITTVEYCEMVIRKLSTKKSLDELTGPALDMAGDSQDMAMLFLAKVVAGSAIDE